MYDPSSKAVAKVTENLHYASIRKNIAYDIVYGVRHIAKYLWKVAAVSNASVGREREFICQVKSNNDIKLNITI